MYINLSNYMESVSNPNGRFKTLEGIYPVRDCYHEPVMTANRLTVNFEMTYKGEAYTLKCLLNDSLCIENLRNISDYTRLIDSPYLTSYTYYPQEMLVFDNFDNPLYVDVILQKEPEGRKLNDFLANCLERGDINSITEVMRKIGDLAYWFTENDFSHGRLTASNIIITSSCTPILINYEWAYTTRSFHDLISLAYMTIILYLSACESEFYKGFKRNSIPIIRELRKNLLLLARGLRETGPEPLKELVLAIQKSRFMPDKHMCDKIAAVAQCDIHKSEDFIALMQRIVGLHRFYPSETENTPEQSRYTHVGHMNDMLRRVEDGQYVKFVNAQGKTIIDGNFSDAEDFAEGRSVVKVDKYYGVIDTTGRYILSPCFEDVEWFPELNVIKALMDGHYGLYSREGEEITGQIYTKMLSPGDGLFAVRKECHFGFIRRDGSVAIDFIYDDAFSFQNGKARVTRNGSVYLIDTAGNIIEELRDSPSKTYQTHSKARTEIFTEFDRANAPATHP